MTTPVFVYGTLTDAERVEGVLDAVSFAGEATLHGLHRVDGAYPTLAPGGTTPGRILRTPEIATLDAYEGAHYVRIAVPWADREGSVAVYVGDSARLDAPAAWPGDGPFGRRVRAYVRREAVVVAGP